MMFSKDKNKPHKTSLNHCHRICRLLKDQDEHQILIGSRRNNSDVIVVARFAQDQFVTKMFIEQMVCVDVCVFWNCCRWFFSSETFCRPENGWREQVDDKHYVFRRSIDHVYRRRRKLGPATLLARVHHVTFAEIFARKRRVSAVHGKTVENATWPTGLAFTSSSRALRCDTSDGAIVISRRRRGRRRRANNKN